MALSGSVFEIWHVTDRQTDRQTSAPFHDMATRSGPHNKCIGDDTKATDYQKPDCILKNKKNMAKTIFNMADGINTLCGTIMTLNSPGGSSQHPAMWQVTLGWHAMEFARTSAILESDFDFDHITAVDMSFCTSLQNFIQIGPPSAKKWRHVEFQDGGSQPSWILVGQ